MTQLRNRPRLNYHTLIVRPAKGFCPRDWRDKPEYYTVISYEGPEQFRGRADAWRFTYNQEMLNRESPQRWAIVCTRLESLSAPSNPVDLNPAHHEMISSR